MHTSHKQYFTPNLMSYMCAAGVGAPSPDALDTAPGADLPQRLHLVHGDRHTRAIPHHCPSQVWYGMVWYGMVWYGMVWSTVTVTLKRYLTIVHPRYGMV